LDPTGIKNCPYCGEQVSTRGEFCEKCGRRLRPTLPKSKLLTAGLIIFLFGLVIPNLFFKLLLAPIGLTVLIIGVIRYRRSSTRRIDGVCGNCRRSLSELTADSSYCAYCGAPFSTTPPVLKVKTPVVFRVLKIFGALMLAPISVTALLSLPRPMFLIVILAVLFPYLLAAIYFLRTRTYRLSLAIPVLLFGTVEFIGLPLPLPLLRHIIPTSPITPYYIWGVAMLKKMWIWYPLEGIIPLFVKLVLITASVVLFMATIIQKMAMKGSGKLTLKGIGLVLTLLPLAYTIMAPIAPPELGYAMQPGFGTGGPAPRLDILLGDCTLTRSDEGKWIYTIPVEYRLVVGPPHGPGEAPLVINKIRLDDVVYRPPFDFAEVEGKGLDVTEKGIVIQPHAKGTVMIIVNEPHGWLIIYDNADNTYPIIW